MLNNEINTLQEELLYHRRQAEELEQRIAEAKSYEAFATEATDAVKSAIEQIGVGKYLWLFKEHILSLFPQEQPRYLEEVFSKEDEIEYLEEGDPDYKSIEELEKEDPDTVVAVYHSEEHPSPKYEEHLKETEDKKEKTYFELTGRPDLRPTTYEDLAPNITYSSDGRAYVGFNNRKEAEAFRERLDVPSLLDEAQIMNDYKWELKFYCEREYLEQFVKVQTPNFEKIDSEIIYNHADSICYVAFSAKGRADNYGSYLTRILDIGEKCTVSKDPQIVDAKYELRLEGINFEDTLHLQSFKLKRDWDHPDNREARELWRTTRQREVEPACNSLPRSTPLEEIELGEIVSVGTNAKQYKVLDKIKLDGIPHLEVIATYNSEMPALVGKTSYLKEVYRVLADDIRIDPMFEEEELNFPAPPYKAIPLSEVELADIVTTSPNSQSAYEVTANLGDHLLATCLYNNSLKHREGQKDFWITEAYLVQKASVSPTLEAA